MSKPDTPSPPDPRATAAAQTGSNVSTGVANAFLNNVNQRTPTGALDYNVTGNFAWTDPSTGQTYQIPRFTATQTLSPQEQAIQDQTEAAKYNLAGLANSQSGRISDLLSNPFDTSGAPAAGDPNAITNVPGAATSFDRGGNMQTSFDPGGDITRSYGPTDNYSADRQRVEDALMARMNPQLSLERQSIEQRLSDQGIRYGSDAYTHAMDDYNRQANDARFAAIGQGGVEQQRLNAMAGQQAAFQNAAQQQGYEQNLGQATFGNQAMGTIFNQNAALGSFQNAGLAQQLAQAQSGFNASQAARNAYLQQAYAQRNQPINEITSLMSGSQVQAPNFVNTPGAQIANTDIAGITNQNFQQQMAAFNANNQNWQGLMGGVLGLGAGAIARSDERVKKNIVRIGSIMSVGADGETAKALPISTFSYKDDPMSVRHIGPMAQDVEKIDPGAVRSIRGVKHIDTHRVMGNILKAA
jgi:hypothetical protein